MPDGVVTIIDTSPLATHAKQTDGSQRAGILGADGATLASAANPVPVTPGTSTLWDVKDRLTRALGILTGRDGTTAASASNGLPVAPETSSVWDVSSRAVRLIGALTGKDGTTISSTSNGVAVAPETSSTWDISSRAARLIGAITGANGSGVASVTNAVPVGGKDSGGSSQTVLVSAAGIVQVQSANGTAVSSTAQEASRVISASACSVSRAAMQNANAAARYLHLHDATSLPPNGTVPKAVFIVGTTQTQVMSWSHPNNRFATGCVAATSTTGPTLTIGSADAIFQVDLFPASA